MSLKNVICPVFRWAWDRTVGACHSTKRCQNPMVSSVRRHRRIREPMYWYRVRSVTGKTALRQIMLLKYETFLV